MNKVIGGIGTMLTFISGVAITNEVAQIIYYILGAIAFITTIACAVIPMIKNALSDDGKIDAKEALEIVEKTTEEIKKELGDKK